MSWMPSADPVLGDKRSCDALELVVVPRVRDLVNGFAVRRAMPNEKRQLVDPFIFFDQMGSVQFLSGQGMDVRPHPPIGLATVTYLFDGRVMHRDSEGNPLEITPGAMNLMTAGRGIAHSERTPGERPPRPRGAVWDPEVDCAYETPILRSNTSTPVI
jgi:redox-sensitive bicupin YhaK (pirin superfamily)